MCRFQLLVLLETKSRWKKGGFCFTFTNHLVLPHEKLEVNDPLEFIKRGGNRENKDEFIWGAKFVCYQPATNWIQHPRNESPTPPSPPQVSRHVGDELYRDGSWAAGPTEVTSQEYPAHCVSLHFFVKAAYFGRSHPSGNWAGFC